MRLFSDARVKAVAASLTAVALLVALVVWRPDGILAVVLALSFVLVAMMAGVAVTAARQARDAQPPSAYQPPAQPIPGGYGVDADTLEALDSRAVRRRGAVNAAPEAGSYGVDADTLEALDSRAVRGSRAVNGVSDR